MCDQDHSNRAEAYDWTANRRQFALAAMAALAGCASGSGTVAANALVEEWVNVPTPDGTMQGFFVRPAKGKHPAILTWPDIAGVREAYLLMARRRAAEGYAVFVANNYYRHAPPLQFNRGSPDFAQGGREKVRPWVNALTPDAITRDAQAVIAWLDRQPSVDVARGIGTDGYCLGGAHVVWTAAAVPERVRAVASLHGWGLVRPEQAESPHKLFGKTRASYLFAIGKNDDEKAPGEKNVLREAAAAAGRPAEIEVYPALHGWMPPDSEVYDAAQAERAWARMSAMFRAM
jgi:carboxymethylenebutenolidase